jgi:UDP-N-acetylmuramoyl-tripeptide--D-alanyl-D-alanine ligase
MINYKNNEYEVFVPIPGLGFVYNALVAFALGTIFNVDIKDIIDGIKNCSITKKRLEIINKKDYTIINDSYNASFDSMKLSLEVLNNRSEKRKIAVLGDMLELGTFSEDIHKKVGKIVASKNIDLLITVGITSKYIASGAYENGMDKSNIYLFDNNKEVLDFLKNNIRNNDVILFKASNRLNLSEIVDNL